LKSFDGHMRALDVGEDLVGAAREQTLCDGCSECGRL
jgi:hypothetical protein